jgi:hypothetical protein
MAKIISFEDRKQQRSRGSSIIQKVIDGEIVEYVDFDFLSLAQQSAMLSRILPSNQNERAET